MITPVNSYDYTVFKGMRKVVDASCGCAPKGITKTPIRSYYEGNSPIVSGLVAFPQFTTMSFNGHLTASVLEGVSNVPESSGPPAAALTQMGAWTATAAFTSAYSS